MPEELSRSPTDKVTPQKPWFLYLIECQDGSIYTGIARDVAARYALHAQGKGARYTRSHPPARLLASLEFPDHSSALKAEYKIKQLKPKEKMAYITGLSTTPYPFPTKQEA